MDAGRIALGQELHEVALMMSNLYLPDDFKPASVDLSKMATLDVTTNNQVTVTVPNVGEY